MLQGLSKTWPGEIWTGGGVPAEFQLRLLGKASVAIADEGVVAGLPKKAFIVAAIVSRAPTKRVAKIELAELLWPDLAPPQRANNLRQLLFRVRQFEVETGLSLFVVSEHEVGLSERLACDLVDFEEVSRRAAAPDAETLLQRYGGRLLGDTRSGGSSLHRWLTDQRLQVEGQFVDMLLPSIDGRSSELRRAVLARAIELAPSALALRKAYMRQLIADGSISEARLQYRAIQQIAGHGAIAAPIELTSDPFLPRPRTAPYPTVPIGQVGRDQAGVPHLALIPPRPTPDARAEFLIAEGLIDDVTVALTRLRSVSILAPHSARKVAKGEDSSGVALARADFVLRTKLTTNAARGRGPRLTLLLERVASGDIVWAEGIALDADRGPIQFAAIANGVALTLVDQIERATLRAFQVPSEAGAYGHYLLGQQALQVLDLPSTRRARASFKAAMSLSPDFAPAYTGFAQTMIYEWVILGRGNADLLLRARHAAERAREIDPLFGSAHQMLGRASLFEGDFTASLAHFEQAEAFNPHHADLLCDFADTLMHSSLAQRANDKIELALRLNPLAPDAYWWASAGIKFFVGEYDGALSHLDRVKNSEPVLRLTAACAAMAGQNDLAKQAHNRFLAIDPGFKLDDWIGVLPVRDPAHRRQYRQALQKAGFK